MPAVQKPVLKSNKVIEEMHLKLLGGTWGLPLVGLAGTVAAISIGFARIGTEPQWITVLVSAGAGVLVVGIALVLLTTAIRIRR